MKVRVDDERNMMHLFCAISHPDVRTDVIGDSLTLKIGPAESCGGVWLELEMSKTELDSLYTALRYASMHRDKSHMFEEKGL